MIFHQKTTDFFTKEMLIDAILKTEPCTKMLHFYFSNYPMVRILSDALDIIDKKRKLLKNPDNHSFLCMEIILKGISNYNEWSKTIDKLADTINRYFHNDLYVISMIYKDKANGHHTIICISDIEKSLPKSSAFDFQSELIEEIFKMTLPEFTIEQPTYDSIYTFRGLSTPLPYDGIFHIKLYATKNHHL